MTTPPTDQAGRRWFDPTINLGHLCTILTLAAGAVMFVARSELRGDLLAREMAMAREAGAAETARLTAAITDLRVTIAPVLPLVVEVREHGRRIEQGERRDEDQERRLGLVSETITRQGARLDHLQGTMAPRGAR